MYAYRKRSESHILCFHLFHNGHLGTASGEVAVHAMDWAEDGCICPQAFDIVDILWYIRAALAMMRRSACFSLYYILCKQTRDCMPRWDLDDRRGSIVLSMFAPTLLPPHTMLPGPETLYYMKNLYTEVQRMQTHLQYGMSIMFYIIIILYSTISDLFFKLYTVYC